MTLGLIKQHKELRHRLRIDEGAGERRADLLEDIDRLELSLNTSVDSILLNHFFQVAFGAFVFVSGIYHANNAFRLGRRIKFEAGAFYLICGMTLIFLGMSIFFPASSPSLRPRM